MWNSPAGRMGHGEQEEINQSQSQGTWQVLTCIARTVGGQQRQSDSLPSFQETYSSAFLLLAGKQWGEGGPRNRDYCARKKKKNMNKTSGVCRLPWVQVDMQKQGSFPSLNPWAHLQNICQVQIYQTGCRIWLARVHLADICLSSLQSISQFSQQLYYTVIVFLLVSSLDSRSLGQGI